MAMNLKGWSILQTFGGQNLNVHDIHREEAKASFSAGKVPSTSVLRTFWGV